MSHFNNRIHLKGLNNSMISALDSKSQAYTRLDISLKNCSDTRMGNQHKATLINTEFNNYDNINFHGCRIDNLYKYPLIHTERPKKKMIYIDKEINGIEDLLQLIYDNPLGNNYEYNINMRVLHEIKEPLEQLNNMIGMKSLKTNVVDQILYFLQDLHKVNNLQDDFLHTVIYGPPGTGKTEVARLMGNIFSKIGILKKRYFKKVTRADLIGGYLGQTALKTRDVIKDALGGVLFIDEAYSLGNVEKRDSFSKECIDTLCEGLSNHKNNLMVIIAGYEDELKKCFFDYNQGLESRFVWRFKTDNYNASELKQIFNKKISDARWSLNQEIDVKWFEKNKDYFIYYGRDMETLFSKTKIAHARRVFCKPKDEKTKLTINDIEQGFKIYLANDEVKKRGEKDSFNRSMYL